MNYVIPQLASGVHNRIDDELIPIDAASESLGFLIKDGRAVLSYGRILVGDSSATSVVRGHHIGYKTNGEAVHYKKASTKIQVLIGSTWTDVVTGLTDSEEYTFANYSSLAGSFTFINGKDGLYKINNAHPTSAIQMYLSTKNFHGKIMIDKGRMILWDRNDTGSKDKTGFYGSKIDPQTSAVYTTVTGEAIGSSGSTAYSGTLAFKGSTTRNCFGVSFSATVAAGTETFTDDFNGVLTSNFGGTGTINYATGVYSVTFSDTTTGAVTSNYQWEDSNAGGITDFTKSGTRVASEGFVFPQDQGGDAILTVLIGPDGAYYSLKKNSVYRLLISDDDLDANNQLYRRDIGIPNFRAAVSTSQGIVFMNTANPDKPELTIITRNEFGDNIEPISLFEHFTFSDYNYDDCVIETYDRYIIVACKSSSGVTNDTLLVCNMQEKSVMPIPYAARTLVKDAGYLYCGSPYSSNIYKLFSGFDDDGAYVTNYFVTKGETYQQLGRLKKYKKHWIKGLIGANQIVQVYADYDDAGWELIGTIRGDASYVDYNSSQTIGSNLIGEAVVGGDNAGYAFPYFCELKVSPTKFRKRKLKFTATEIGYFDIETITDKDVILFEERIPKRFRQKQNVSLDGASTDQ